MSGTPTLVWEMEQKDHTWKVKKEEGAEVSWVGGTYIPPSGAAHGFALQKLGKRGQNKKRNPDKKVSFKGKNSVGP